MPSPLSSRAQRGTLAVVCLATAMLMLDIAVVNTALPYVARDLHSRLTVASLACGLAGSVALLDGARTVQGLASALMFASSLAILADAFPGTRERAGAMAAYGATIGASFAVGPAVGGALTTAFGWRWVFFINVPLGLIGLIGAVRWVRESRDPRARKLDWPGQASLSAGLFLLVLALLRGNVDGWSSGPSVAELAGAALLLGGFGLIEARVRTPMLPLGLFGRRDFTAAQIAAFAISATGRRPHMSPDCTTRCSWARPSRQPAQP